MIYENCPICSKTLSKQSETLNPGLISCESFCEKEKDHSFFSRWFNEEPNQTQIIKIAFKGDSKIFLKLNYQLQKSFIWTKPNDVHPIKVSLFEPDFSDIPKLKKKLKTLLLFI
jgi:hypothetical protein